MRNLSGYPVPSWYCFCDRHVPLWPWTVQQRKRFHESRGWPGYTRIKLEKTKSNGEKNKQKANQKKNLKKIKKKLKKIKKNFGIGWKTENFEPKKLLSKQEFSHLIKFFETPIFQSEFFLTSKPFFDTKNSSVAKKFLIPIFFYSRIVSLPQIIVKVIKSTLYIYKNLNYKISKLKIFDFSPTKSPIFGCSIQWVGGHQYPFSRV